MGCFDTFVGKIECPKCNKLVKIEEQTKSYDCLLSDFKVGDYIDKGNSNYFYEFDQYCQKCKETFKTYAIIRNGQLVGYSTDIAKIDIMSIENIEDGYQRRLDYEDMCKNGYGTQSKCTYTEKALKKDSVINVLGTDWFIDEIYKEVLKETENKALQSFWHCCYKDNFVYIVHDAAERKRIIISRNLPYTFVRAVDLENIEDYATDEEMFHIKYTIEMGCELIKIG